jgi:hypothetical protein
MTHLIGLVLVALAQEQDLDEAQKALEAAREAVRRGAPAAAVTAPPAPAPPPERPTIGELWAERERRHARQEADRAEAMRLLGEARHRRADQLSVLYGHAAHPLELPVSLAAIPPGADFERYPLYIPRSPMPDLARTFGVRVHHHDEILHARRHRRADGRAWLERWTAAHAAAAPAEADFEERWGAQALQVKRALAR